MNKTVRELIQLTKEEVFQLPNYKDHNLPKIPENRLIYQVTFDDKTIPLTKHQIIISWCYWELFRRFPTSSILSTMCVSGDFNADLHRQIGKIIIWHIYDSTLNPSEDFIWQLTECFYDVGNIIFNLSCEELAEYMTTVSIYDITEVLREPKLKEAKTRFLAICEKEPTNEVVISDELSKVYKVLNDLLFTNKEYLRDNQIKKLCLAGVVNKGQIMQLFAPRGYVHDIDNCVFPYPVTASFAEGLTSLYDSAVESRSASKAYIMTTDPLEQSELFNRKMQLAASAILGSFNGSCTDYITFDYLVRPEDELLLRGKYYMEDNQPKMIWGDISSIVGKMIKLRSVTGCGSHDPQYVCEYCLGWSKRIIPPRANLGYSLSLPLLSRISQTIMSTKHFDVSSISKVLQLSKSASKWFVSDKSNNKLYLSDYALSGPSLLRIESKYVENLHQILHIDVKELTVSRVAEIPLFGMTFLDKEGQHDGVFDKIYLAIDGKGVNMSVPLLQYIKQNGWHSGKGYIEFDLRDWDNTKPILVVPKIGDNIMSFFNDIKSFINAQQQEKQETVKVTNFKTRGAAIEALIALLDRRLKGEYNMVQVEVFIRSVMMIDFKDKKYGLPTTKEDFNFVGLEKVLFKRNLVSMLAYQEQYQELLNPQWQLLEPTTKHMLDSIITY